MRPAVTYIVRLASSLTSTVPKCHQLGTVVRAANVDRQTTLPAKMDTAILSSIQRRRAAANTALRLVQLRSDRPLYGGRPAARPVEIAGKRPTTLKTAAHRCHRPVRSPPFSTVPSKIAPGRLVP